MNHIKIHLLRMISNLIRGGHQGDDESTVSRLNVLLTGDQKRRWAASPHKKFLARETPEGLLLRPDEKLPTKIYLEPTTKCNLRCSTCMRNSWDEPEGVMDFELYKKLLKQTEKIATIKTIAFWGLGEPLMHPNIIQMIASAKERGLKTELITNGILLDRNVAQEIVRSGLDVLVVSLDGVSPESNARIRTGADLNLIQNNLGYLNAVKHMSGCDTPKIGIEFVIMRQNLGELSELPALARRLKAEFIVVSNVLPYKKELQSDILYGVSASLPFNVRLDNRTSGLAIPKIDVRRETRESLVSLRMNADAYGFQESSHQKAEAYCPFVGEGSIAVRWDGDISPCIPLLHS